jgi:hypothetical protein
MRYLMTAAATVGAATTAIVPAAMPPPKAAPMAAGRKADGTFGSQHKVNPDALRHMDDNRNGQIRSADRRPSP